MIPTPLDLRQNHRLLLGTDPSDKQCRIYDAFPVHRGVSDNSFDVELFQAYIVVAVVQTYTRKTQPDPFRTYLFVPSTHEKWAIEQLQGFAKNLFKRIKAQKASEAAQVMGRAFKAVMLGCKVLKFEVAPERWVCFGFSKANLVPTWMAEALLEIEIHA